MKLVKQLKLSNAKSWPSLVDIALREAWKWQKDIVITIKEDSGNRSVKQNALMWMWHTEWCRHVEASRGEIINPDDWHEVFKKMFLGVRVVTYKYEPLIVPNSTTGIRPKEFADLLCRYETQAAEDECYFTKPEDLYIDALMRQESERETDGL